MIIAFFKKLLQLLQIGNPAERLFRRFDENRTALEAQFFERAGAAGSPRGLRWIKCEWLDSRCLLKDRSNGQPCLLVSVNLSFEAIEGGDMENVAAVSMIRDACAVFQMTANGWQASGRALFNMNPQEAQEKLATSYAPFLS